MLPPLFIYLLQTVGLMTGAWLARAHLPHGGIAVIVGELGVVVGVLGGALQDVDLRSWELVHAVHLAHHLFFARFVSIFARRRKFLGPE